MKHNARDIPFLNESSKQREISTIITNGLDPKASFWSYLANMYKQVGFRFMFKDFAEILFTLLISIVIVLAFILSSMDYMDTQNVNLYTIIFIWSPVTYLLMAYLFFLNQKKKTTYEVEMTCKYNLHQLAAFRMLAFSVVSMIINGLFIYALNFQHDLNFLYAFLLSSSSLFLFALIFLYVQLHTKTRASKIILLTIWLSSNLLASYYNTNLYMNVLQQIPFYVYGVMAIVSIILYVKNLKEMLLVKKMKGLI
ncbi:hypothetical protein GCM10008983_07500 [Lentibacillus halophilus]|uniref:ABC-2 type transport system permease protein n=1 Tax=Lentibacillus halophilus TaxID=295065 RepID=A0ABN0Z5B3_9BACI